MLAIAQTNLQLFNQLSRQQRSVPELHQVRAAHDLAILLFSARYRASGKPFVAHLIGVASVLAWLEQPANVIAAGLLHAAYESGDFGDGAAGHTLSRQQQLIDAVGEPAGALITAYQQLTRAQAMARLAHNDLPARDSAEHAVLLLHLADTVEEYADGGMNYAPGKRDFHHRACQANVGSATLDALCRLDYAAHVPELGEVFAAADACRPPAELRTSRVGSFTLLPASTCERPSVRWRRLWRRAFAWAAADRPRPASLRPADR